MSYVEVLGKALLSVKGEEKIRIAYALKELEDSRAEPYLLQALDNRNRHVREAVAFALSFIATPMSESKLIKLLADKHFGVRTFAARGLGHMRSRSAVPKLIEVLEDEESSVRSAAVEALGEIGDPDAVEHLVRLLEDRELVYGILRSLGAIGCLDSAEAIMTFLEDSDEKARTFALMALKSIPDAIPMAKLEELIEKESNTLNRSLVEDLIQMHTHERSSNP